jgi:hypothetical protein
MSIQSAIILITEHREYTKRTSRKGKTPTTRLQNKVKQTNALLNTNSLKPEVSWCSPELSSTPALLMAPVVYIYTVGKNIFNIVIGSKFLFNKPNSAYRIKNIVNVFQFFLRILEASAVMFHLTSQLYTVLNSATVLLRIR